MLKQKQWSCAARWQFCFAFWIISAALSTLSTLQGSWQDEDFWNLLSIWLDVDGTHCAAGVVWEVSAYVVMPFSCHENSMFFMVTDMKSGFCCSPLKYKVCTAILLASSRGFDAVKKPGWSLPSKAPGGEMSFFFSFWHKYISNSPN